MERRQFLKSAAAAGLAAASPATIAQKAETNSKTSKGASVSRPENPAMIYRELGTTGERVSVIGMGGFISPRIPA
jgi:FtsP/CotA-like multicopper oxidase with cupredoxin domain